MRKMVISIENTSKSYRLGSIGTSTLSCDFNPWWAKVHHKPDPYLKIGQIAQLSTDGLPQFLFYLSGTVVWRYFADCLTKTSTTFVSNAGLFGKVYFPRLAVPVSILFSNLITFSIQFAFFLVFLAYFMLAGAKCSPTAGC